LIDGRIQTAKTGAIGEYSEIEETMSPVALEKVASWILKIVGVSGEGVQHMAKN